jgi:hypothetical protein
MATTKIICNIIVKCDYAISPAERIERDLMGKKVSGASYRNENYIQRKKTIISNL